MSENKKRNIKNILYIMVYAVLLIGILRFVYSITKSCEALFRTAYSEGVYNAMLVAKQTNIVIGRSWGPILIIIMNGIKATPLNSVFLQATVHHGPAPFSMNRS